MMFCAACGISPVWACDTPVFRYAMYNWPPAPYYVFYLHHGQVAKEDEAINKSLDGLCRAEPPANLVLAAVDVSNEGEFKKLPEVVRRAFQSRAQAQQPLHLVFSPWVLFYAWAAEPDDAGPPDKKADTPPQDQPGLAPLFAGRLDAKQLQAMVDSPARKRLAELLKEGNGAVLLILTGPDEDANRQAEKAAGEVVAMAAKGKFPISGGEDYTLQGFLPQASEKEPGDDGWPGSSGASPQQSPSGASLRAAASHPSERPNSLTADRPDSLKLAVLKLSRTEPAEKWLVDCLLSVEPDLRESQYAKSPMVFAVFGRGRVMLPFVGKGITTANLADCIRFLAGPCSCNIGDRSAGVDLLVRCDWDAVAETLAAKDPQSAGGPLGYREFLPNEAGDQTDAPAAADGRAETASAAGPQPQAAPPPLAQRSPSPPETQAMGGQVPAESAAPLGSGSDSFALEQAWKIGIWLGLGAAVVLIVGLVLVVRQRPG